MDKKLKNDLMDIAAELVVSPLTAYVKGREIYNNFAESETGAKIMDYADKKGKEFQDAAKKISVNVNEKASGFAKDLSDRAVDFSKKSVEFSKKAGETIDDFSERKENFIYEFTGKADDAIKGFADNVKTTAKEFGGTVSQKVSERQDNLDKILGGANLEKVDEPEVVLAEPVLESVASPVVEPITEPIASPIVEPIVNPVAASAVDSVAKPVIDPIAMDDEEPIAPQANTIFENNKTE